MTYYIAQGMGILSMICCLVMPQLNRKRNMLLVNGLNNLLAAGNILLLAGAGSGMMVCLVAVVQVMVTLVHVKRESPVAGWENVLFLVLYVGCGLLGYRTAVDALPILGAVFNMLSTFQRDEQRTRWLLLVNASVFAVYYVIIGSTGVLSVLCTIVSTVLGLWRYRKKGE